MELLLILAAIIGALVLGYFLGKLFEKYAWERKVPEIRKLAVERSRAVLAGQFSEQLAPYLPDFPWSPSEARFIGKPIDFLVFRGADERNIEEVVFVEVKSGKSQLSSQERKLRDVIKEKKVRWKEYRIPQELTKWK
jgi:predicted Holliday junction resolvase-like endonuclease